VTVGDRLARAATALQLARAASGSGAADIFGSSREHRDAIDRVLSEVVEDVSLAREGLPAQCLKRQALTDDDKDARLKSSAEDIDQDCQRLVVVGNEE
jgi:hypothetical protein